MGKPTRVTNDIRRLRFAGGETTQAELADRLGVTRHTVIAIEQGRTATAGTRRHRTATAGTRRHRRRAGSVG